MIRVGIGGWGGIFAEVTNVFVVEIDVDEAAQLALLVIQMRLETFVLGRQVGEQLADGGRLLIPLGGRDEQTLHLFTRTGDTLEKKDIAPVRFVPLVGKYSWES